MKTKTHSNTNQTDVAKELDSYLAKLLRKTKKEQMLNFPIKSGEN